MNKSDDTSAEQFALQLPDVQWTLTTRRLVLRPYQADDAPRITELVSRREVAATTLHIPHPYPDGAAASFIERVGRNYENGEGLDWAVCLAESGELIGGMGIGFDVAHRRAELGYWIAPQQWSRGFATEAAQAVVRLGFETLNLHRIDAHYFGTNPASGRVLANVGMRQEGVLRQHVFKWGEPIDVILCGILRSEYDPQHST